MAGYLVKICANRYFRDSLAVAARQPDFMGWIFSPRSPRRIFVDQARPQLRAIRARYPRIRHVAVFADNSLFEIGSVLAALPEIDLVQLVGDAALTDSYRRLPGLWTGLLRRPLRLPALVPALRVGRAMTDQDLLPYGRPDLFLLDSYVRGVPGGTGHRLESDFVRGVRRPFLLAGGLDPENVVAALGATPAIGADVASGLELAGAPGRKDLTKVAAFIDAVRSIPRPSR